MLDAGFRVTSTPSTCSSISPAMVNIIRWREDRQKWREDRQIVAVRLTAV